MVAAGTALIGVQFSLTPVGIRLPFAAGVGDVQAERSPAADPPGADKLSKVLPEPLAEGDVLLGEPLPPKHGSEVVPREGEEVPQVERVLRTVSEPVHCRQGPAKARRGALRDAVEVDGRQQLGEPARQRHVGAEEPNVGGHPRVGLLGRQPGVPWQPERPRAEMAPPGGETLREPRRERPGLPHTVYQVSWGEVRLLPENTEDHRHPVHGLPGQAFVEGVGDGDAVGDQQRGGDRFGPVRREREELPEDPVLGHCGGDLPRREGEQAPDQGRRRVAAAAAAIDTGTGMRPARRPREEAVRRPVVELGGPPEGGVEHRGRRHCQGPGEEPLRRRRAQHRQD
mmetsp:Transcript_10037/g.24718  ORF Transcript_10037/g.24718 Transcript_10037/m.24718 type:complete len:341 (+) Transcript_10037:625-1647(+)